MEDLDIWGAYGRIIGPPTADDRNTRAPSGTSDIAVICRTNGWINVLARYPWVEGLLAAHMAGRMLVEGWLKRRFLTPLKCTPIMAARRE